MRYIAIVRKTDFIDLFKYGYFYINNAIPVYDMSFESISDNKTVIEALTARMNPFEYSFEYLLLYFEKEKYEECSSMVVLIREVLKLYAFDEQAKREFLNSFDIRVDVNVINLADKFIEIQNTKSFKQNLLGIDNVWDIFNLPIEDKKICEKEITQSILRDSFEAKSAGEKVSGDKSIWNYVLGYERHSYYFKDVRGYFCDLVHVYCNYCKHDTLLDVKVELTDVYKDIMGSSANFKEIVEIINKSKFGSQVKEEFNDIDISLIVPLFFWLRDISSEGLDSSTLNANKKTFEYAKTFDISSSFAFYLLGFVLGYDKTYDAWYDAIKLPIFNKEPSSNSSLIKVSNTSTTDNSYIEKSSALNSDNQCGAKGVNHNQSYIDNNLFPNECSDFEPIHYYKKGEGKNRKNDKIARTAEEARELENKGYLRRKTGKK